MKIILVLIFLSTATYQCVAQPPAPSTEDLSRLDFWIGKWALTWEGGAGTNYIEKILDGRVVQEHFETTEGEAKGYKGTSISTFNGRDQQWHQTWADSQGGYIDLIGKMEGSDLIFQTNEPRKQPDGNMYIFRMRFTDITKDHLIWIWERSSKKGEIWEEVWKIDYQRQ